MRRGFINQKLGKRNNRRAELLKAKAFSRPSRPKSGASKSFGANAANADRPAR